MDSTLVAFLIIVGMIAFAIVAWVLVRNQRTARLRRRFGAEYDRTVRIAGPRNAELLLMERKKRVESFPIRQLGAEEREKFITDWRTVQSRFVDNPRRAVDQADLLVQRLMRACGYPMAEFEQRAADISVSHASVVDNYRAAHQIALRHRKGQASTEDLRAAIIYYRSLFDELLQTEVAGPQKEVA